MVLPELGRQVLETLLERSTCCLQGVIHGIPS
jgi:hypothetical protein